MTSDGNNVSLKEFVAAILAEHQHGHNVQHQASERALDAAFAASEKAVRAALDTQQRATDAAFLASAAAVSAALSAQERQSAAINDAQDHRLVEMRMHFDAILASHAQAHADAHAADSRAVQAALQAQKEANFSALASSKEAVAKAEDANQRRFESVNEFRSALSDQQRNLMSRSEATALLQGMQDKLADLTTRIDRGEGRGSGLQAGWGYLVTGIGLFLTLLTIGGILFAVTR